MLSGLRNTGQCVCLGLPSIVIMASLTLIGEIWKCTSVITNLVEENIQRCIQDATLKTTKNAY